MPDLVSPPADHVGPADWSGAERTTPTIYHRLLCCSWVTVIVRTGAIPNTLSPTAPMTVIRWVNNSPLARWSAATSALDGNDTRFAVRATIPLSEGTDSEPS